MALQLLKTRGTQALGMSAHTSLPCGRRRRWWPLRRAAWRAAQEAAERVGAAA